MDFLRKYVGQQWYPNQYYGSPPYYYANIKIWGIPQYNKLKYTLPGILLHAGFKMGI